MCIILLSSSLVWVQHSYSCNNVNTTIELQNLIELLCLLYRTEFLCATHVYWKFLNFILNSLRLLRFIFHAIKALTFNYEELYFWECATAVNIYRCFVGTATSVFSERRKVSISLHGVIYFISLGITAQGELWPPEQSASILLYSEAVWFLNSLVFMVWGC
jgi:hypothetical protein